MLRKVDPKVSGKVFVCGILPSVLFYCPIYGLFGRSLQKLRVESGVMNGIHGKKKNIDLAMSFYPKKDPEVWASKAVVFRFCQEVWNASAPKGSSETRLEFHLDS